MEFPPHIEQNSQENQEKLPPRIKELAEELFSNELQLSPEQEYELNELLDANSMFPKDLLRMIKPEGWAELPEKQVTSLPKEWEDLHINDFLALRTFLETGMTPATLEKVKQEITGLNAKTGTLEWSANNAQQLRELKRQEETGLGSQRYEKLNQEFRKLCNMQTDGYDEETGAKWDPATHGKRYQFLVQRLGPNRAKYN